MSSSIPSNAFLMIIGAGKSGTTTLFRMLSQHPGICPARRKEPNFFLCDQSRNTDVQHYEDLYDFTPGCHIKTLEASVRYTTFPWEMDVARRIKEYGIDPLFIYCVRHPFDRLESDYNFSQLSLSRDTRNILDLGAVHRSMYYMQLREFLRWYPDKDRYFIVDFDDIAARPLNLAAQVFQWAGLPAHEIGSPIRENETPAFSRMEYRLKKSPILWRSYLPSGLRRAAARLLRRYDASAKRALTKHEREQFREWLQPDMERFHDTFGFPVEKWGFRTQQAQA